MRLYSSRAGRKLWIRALMVVLAPWAAMACAAQQPAGPVSAWVSAATQNEVDIIQQEGTFPVRYRERKVDTKGDTTREVVVSREGSVARLVERNGNPLTAAEDAAERARLQEILASPEEFLRHHRRDNALRADTVALVQLMPKAMIYGYTPGQPQPTGAESPQVVVDFHPDPNFHPPTMAAELLTGLEGRLWIDARTQRLTRVEARVLHPVNFGWGVVARIYPGGTVEFEQTDAGSGRWMYSRLDEHLNIRELMFKTQLQNTRMNSWDFRVMPSAVGYQDAVRILLAMPVSLR